MTAWAKPFVAGLVAMFIVAPAGAQYPYPQPYPTYPPSTYPSYPNQPYGEGVVDQMIGQLLGNNYSVNDRQAVSQCASAAMARAQNDYRYGNNGGYQQPYGQNNGGYPQPYGQGFAPPMMRVTAITQVERRTFGLRVRGLIDSGYYGQWGYQNQGYATGDLKFRCTVDYRGYVSDVRVDRNDDYRRY